MLKIDWNPPARQLSQFGWISLIGFPALWCAWLGIARLAGRADPPTQLLMVLSGIGLVVFVLSRIDPRLVKYVFLGLMVITWPIAMTISFTLMALIYYGMFLPVGLVFRLLGRDPLNRRIDRQAESYWVVRDKSRTAASYMRLY